MCGFMDLIGRCSVLLDARLFGRSCERNNFSAWLPFLLFFFAGALAVCTQWSHCNGRGDCGHNAIVGSNAALKLMEL